MLALEYMWIIRGLVSFLVLAANSAYKYWSSRRSTVGILVLPGVFRKSFLYVFHCCQQIIHTVVAFLFVLINTTLDRSVACFVFVSYTQ
uniref:Uncharacterized protein n=1 Tax=Oryza brachyantha TaxID=4533 RepID=J3MD23_ORYBR